MNAARPRRLRWWQPAAVAAAAVLTVALTQSTTGAVFTAQTGNAADQVTAAPDFCTAPGRVDTLPTAGYPTVDTGIYQTQPATDFSGNATIGTISASGALARSLIKFSLKGRPSGCVVASAVLALHVSSGTVGSFTRVYRAATAWGPTTVRWPTDPGYVAGTFAEAATAGNGSVVQWDVAALVTALYAGPDYGFEIKDANEGVGATTQLFDSMEATTVANRPQLVITWG